MLLLPLLQWSSQQFVVRPVHRVDEASAPLVRALHRLDAARSAGAYPHVSMRVS